MTPLLSVLMITYNHEAFIGSSIESVLAQQVDFSYELVIGDDHSTDRTPEIARQYAEKYPDKIRLLSHEQNMGVITNFQHTLSRCRGKYIAMLEGDDRWIDVKKLQRQVDFLEKNPEYVMCGGHTISESSNKTFIYKLIRIFKYFKQPTLSLQTYDLDEVIISNHFKTLTVVFRSEFLRKPLHESFYSSTILDWLIYISLGLHKGMKAKYANLPHILAAYNVHAGGIFSGTSRSRRLEVFSDVRKCINTATDQKYFGFHLPVIMLNEMQHQGQAKTDFLGRLFEAYENRFDTSTYLNKGKEETINQIRQDIHEVSIEQMGFLFALLYIYSDDFDDFTRQLALLMKKIKDKNEATKYLRAMAAAWRASMFYERFSFKTVLVFKRSLLSKYADIYAYTLILTLWQNSKRPLH